MSKSNHLNTFTSIISLLKAKNPSMSQQLDCLRQAIIQWHESMQQKIINKNKAILTAKTRGSQKLYVLLNQIQNFFKNTIRSYSDPNLPKFYKMFKKIKEQFQFMDIDFQKFNNKLRNKEIQTDRQSIYIYGVDVNKFINGVQNKQLELEHSRDKIAQLQLEINNFKSIIEQLQQKIKDNDEQSRRKGEELQQLRQKMQKNKVQIVSSARNQAERKNNIVYRSNPQINNYQSLGNKKIIMNLLSHAMENQSINQEDHVSIQQIKVERDPQFFTMLYCQALAIQGMLASVEAYQKGRMQ